MKRLASILACVVALAVPMTSLGQNRPVVMQARIDNQVIGPATVRYVNRVIGEAEVKRAACLVIVLDTPGGLLESTRAVIKRMLESRVPIVVHVAPSGARAASAGAFITMAGHKAAMAPGTNIGAAHPVQVGGLPVGPGRKDGEDGGGRVMEEKVVNDTVAWAKSLARLRNRSEAWAERAIRESLSASADEAVRDRAVDLIARDTQELLEKIHGETVQVQGRDVVLNTKDADVQDVPMWWGEQALAAITNPNIAFLLLIFGFFGVLFEFKTPGWGVGGTLGVLCLLLGFMSLAVLPVNYAGLLLILAALAMFVAEGFVVSYGTLTIGGLVCLGLGGTMLIDSPEGFERVSLYVIAPVGLATAFVTVFLVSSIVKAYGAKVQTGGEALIGAEAVVLEPFRMTESGYSGQVRIQGEIWKAISPMPLATGQIMEVAERHGLVLHLRPPLEQPNV